MIVAPLRVALEKHAEVVGRHFGTVARPGYFAKANADAWTDGTLVYVPRNVKVDAPVLITTVQDQPGTTLHHRTLIVLEEGARGRGLGPGRRRRTTRRRSSTASSRSSSATTRT